MADARRRLSFGIDHVSPQPHELATLRDLAARAEAELRGNILPFWLSHARDHARGGFFGAVGLDLAGDRDAPRGSVLTSRVLWAFSAAYRRYRDPAYREMARWAREDLLSRFFDERRGSLYWSIRPTGRPLERYTPVYGQAFGIFGLSEYYLATGDEVALDRAVAIYEAVERHARDEEHGGYFEMVGRWPRRGLPVRRAATWELPPPGLAKSHNTHLHVVEAYASLLQAWPDSRLRRQLRELVDLLLDRMLDGAGRHFHVWASEDWVAHSDDVWHGHDIEFGWLLCEVATALDDPELVRRVRSLAVRIADAVLRDGVDRDGGVFTTARAPAVRKKEWWPQAEAVVGFINAWQLSREPRFLEAACGAWDFIERHLVNHEAGEWFHAVLPDGTPDRAEPLISFWKCPYHNTRACLELLRRAEAVATAPTKQSRRPAT